MRLSDRSLETNALWPAESVLSQITDPARFPVPSTIRVELAMWRLYHSFRTDEQALSPHPQPGVRTPVLAHDGRDLAAAALLTILEIGDDRRLRDAVRRALGGAELNVLASDGCFVVELQMPGLMRSLSAVEFSDGMLRFLSLAAALLSPRPAHSSS